MYMQEAKDAALNSLLNAVVKVTDSRVMNEQVLEQQLINFMITLVVEGKISYEHSQQISIVVRYVKHVPGTC